MIVQQTTLDEAMAAREVGMAQAERNGDVFYIARLDATIARLAREGIPFCADDIRRAVGNPPLGTSYNVVGGCFSRAAKSGLIRMVGYTHSSRVIGHSNLVRQWIGA